jgi:hypothetical protein
LNIYTINKIEAREKQKERNRKHNLLQSRIDFTRRRIASFENYNQSDLLTTEQQEEVRKTIADELNHLEKLEAELQTI